MYSIVWWKRALERAVKSAVQGALGATGIAISGDTAVNIGLIPNAVDVSWQHVLLTAAWMGGLSVASSIITARWGPQDDPGLV